MKKIKLIFVLFALDVFNVFSLEFSPYFNPDLPVAIMGDYWYNDFIPTVRELFYSGTQVLAYDGGMGTPSGVSIDSKNISEGIFTVVLTLYFMAPNDAVYNGRTIHKGDRFENGRIKMQFASEAINKRNYVVYFRMVNLINGNEEEKEYYGDSYSLEQCFGAFLAFFQYYVDVDALTAAHNKSFGATHKVIDSLRLRESPNMNSEAITVLPVDTLLKVLETGKQATIDGITAPWVRVQTISGLTGWCFSGYLKKL